MAKAGVCPSQDLTNTPSQASIPPRDAALLDRPSQLDDQLDYNSLRSRDLGFSVGDVQADTFNAEDARGTRTREAGERAQRRGESAAKSPTTAREGSSSRGVALKIQQVPAFRQMEASSQESLGGGRPHMRDLRTACNSGSPPQIHPRPQCGAAQFSFCKIGEHQLVSGFEGAMLR